MTETKVIDGKTYNIIREDLPDGGKRVTLEPVESKPEAHEVQE